MNEKIIIVGTSGAGRYSMSKLLQAAMSGEKQFEMCKLSTEEEQEQIRSMLSGREMKLDQIKAKDILDNIGMIKDQDLLKEAYRRGLNLGFPIDSLESVSTTKLNAELRSRKK